MDTPVEGPCGKPLDKCWRGSGSVHWCCPQCDNGSRDHFHFGNLEVSSHRNGRLSEMRFCSYHSRQRMTFVA
jgi:hypothetical protein